MGLLLFNYPPHTTLKMMWPFPTGGGCAIVHCRGDVIG